MKSTSRASAIGSVVAIVLLGFSPVVAPLIHVDISTFTNSLLTCLAVMSVNLLLGYTGFSAFGQAAFYGLGAYGAALSVQYWHASFLEAVAIGCASAFVGALLVGPFLLRRRGIYFALLAIAFGQVFYFIAYRSSDITGGEDGMQFARPPLVLPGLHMVLGDTAVFYAALIAFALAMLSFWLIVRSPFGRTLVAIKQNEVRVRYLGLNTDRFVFMGILVSSVYAGLGGALYALSINFAFPLMLDWHQSGFFVLMTVLGGAGTLWGPLVGAAIYVVGKDIISTITPAWEIYLGVLFVACVLAFPRGIVGTLQHALRQRRDGAAAPEAHDPLEEAGVPHSPAQTNGARNGSSNGVVEPSAVRVSADKGGA